MEVVDSHSTLQVTQESIRVLGHALIRPVASLEVQNCSPVVREVLREAAGCASSLLGNILARVHSRIEGISTDDLVEVGRRDGTRLNERVKTLDANSGTSESEVRLGRRSKREGESKGRSLHLDSVDLDVGVDVGICDTGPEMVERVEISADRDFPLTYIQNPKS